MIKQAGFDQGYTVTQDGDARHIVFKGDGLAVSGYFALPFYLLLMLMGLGMILPPSSWPVPVLLIIGFAYVIYRMFQKQTFTLTPKAIIKDGVAYDLARISDVLIDNPMDKSFSQTGQPIVMTGGAGLAAASASALVGANMAIAQSSAKRRFRVRIRYGSKAITLARNLKYERAAAIFQLLSQP